MNMQPQPFQYRQRLHSIAVWLAALLLGALFALLTVFLFYRMGGLLQVAPVVQLSGTQLQLTKGQGGLTANGLEIHQADQNGFATVQVLLKRRLPARLFRQWSWRLHGLESHHSLHLIWVSMEAPQTVRHRQLPSLNQGSVDLSAETHWQGKLALVGLMVGGTFSKPLTVAELALHPVPLSSAELWHWAWAEWSGFQDWTQGSINFAAGSGVHELFPLVLIVALWLGFSAVFYALFRPPRWSVIAWQPYAAFFLCGWFLLDAHWQWELQRRLQQTKERFAGKDMTQRRLADLDGEFYRFLLEVRRHLPPQPARLFIVSEDPSTFFPGRARYHLLPHNGYMGFIRPPHQALANDYLLILPPLPAVQYDATQQKLVWEAGQLPAVLRYSAPQGELFQIGGGG